MGKLRAITEMRPFKSMFLLHFESPQEGEFCRLLLAQSARNEPRPGGIVPKFRWRIQLILWWWPQLVAYGVKNALEVARRSDVATVLAWSHLVLLPFMVLRWLNVVHCKLILVGFIFSPRETWWARLHEFYIRRIIHSLDLAIVHAKEDCGCYAQRFQVPLERFAFIPLAGHMFEFPEPGTPKVPYVVAAGRSNRDYEILLDCAPSIPRKIVIVCDSFGTSAGLPANVEVCRDTYDNHYFQLLAGAEVVVLPLKRPQVTSGQMVLLHAMALGRPIVMTRSCAADDYLEDGATALLMDPGSPESLCRQVRTLLDDSPLAKKLGSAARERFLERHTLTTYVQGLCAIASLDEQPPAEANGR